jgi:adenosine deaminase
MHDFIGLLPKAELHVHLLGTLQPEQVIRYAKRNNINLPYGTQQNLQSIYRSCNNLASFLEIYKRTQLVMKTELDFYEQLYTYLELACKQGILHTEIFFEVQPYKAKGIPFSTIINGLYKAKIDAHKNFAISCDLILCFLRDRPEEEALTILEESLAHKEKIIGIGLASNERDYPPSLFIELYKRAKNYSYKLSVHAGEEAGPDYIWQALELLHADRIDHGVACMQDQTLLAHLVKHQIPITVCPLSNIKLGLFNQLKNHPIEKMLETGLLVSINSDDPAFFGSLTENFIAVQQTFSLNNEKCITFARNAFLSSFLDQYKKQEYLSRLNTYCNNYQR